MVYWEGQQKHLGLAFGRYFIVSFPLVTLIPLNLQLGDIRKYATQKTKVWVISSPIQSGTSQDTSC